MTFSPPSAWSGSTEAKLQACYRYLYTLQEKLNLALSSLDEGNFAPSVQKSLSAYTQSAANLTAQANALKALVVKNAQLVEGEMDAIRQELRGSYVAASDFGDYVARLSATIQADPAALTQYYSFASDLQGAVEKVDAAFSAYRTQTEGYVRTGTVYMEDGKPVYGVAVGQGLTQTEVDGETVVTSRQFRSVFTAGKLSFYQGDTEVAFLSNNQLYITQATVTGAVTLGAWSISHQNGFAIRYIGT
jgi:hypothetical protein